MLSLVFDGGCLTWIRDNLPVQLERMTLGEAGDDGAEKGYSQNSPVDVQEPMQCGASEQLLHDAHDDALLQPDTCSSQVSDKVFLPIADSDQSSRA